jgi:hypothetical protein
MVTQRRTWPDPKTGKIHRLTKTERELGPGGAALGVVSLAGDATSVKQEREKPAWGYFMREAGKPVKWHSKRPAQADDGEAA